MLKQIWIDLRVRLSALFGRRTLNARAHEEMVFHLTMREQQLMDRGVRADEARSQARREFGNALLLREATIDSWRYAGVKHFFDGIWSDIRYAARWLWRTPGFTAAAIVTIALGVGVNAGIFTVLNGLLFRDLQAPDAHELVSIYQTVEEDGQDDVTSGVGTFSTSEYNIYRDQAQTLSGVLALGNAPMTTLAGDRPQLILGSLVSCNHFDVLGQPPALGRGLSAEDCEPGALPVVILSRTLWRTTFAADTGILGRTVQLNRHQFTVVGVSAEGTYAGPRYGILDGGYMAPISADPLLRSSGRFQNDQQRWLNLIGRRKDGTGLGQVRAELGVIAARIDQQQPGRSTKLTVESRIPTSVPPDQRGAILGGSAVLMAAFVSVLLIACANVANLLLARGSARSQEIGIRLSLGASRARVIRQLLTESMLISIAGGLLGSVLAMWSFQSLVARALPALLPPGFPVSLAFDLGPDLQALIVAVAMTFGTGILFGLVPALHASRPDVQTAIKQDGAGAGANRRGGRLRGVLVGVQVALCMTLMIAAGLLLRGLYVTHTVDTGFEYRDVAFVSLESALDVHGPEEATAFRRRLMAEVEALPGVTAAAYTDRQPLGMDNAAIRIRLPDESEETSRTTQLISVTPQYFSVLELPIVRGRTFTNLEVQNRTAGALPIIVSEATARNLWPGADAIGRTLISPMLPDQTLQVVGVAADARINSLGTIDPYYIYIPGGGAALLVKSRVGFGATASSLRATLRDLDPTLAIDVLPLEANLAWWRGLSGIIAALGTGLGVLALVLASVGIYGVVAYSVSRRYREIGIRMALGAESHTVLGMILRQTMRPVIIGALIGVAAASALSRILTSVLFGVSPTDPVGLGGAVLLVLGVALVAGVMAVRPATRSNPTAALRHE
jgi:macrolide transport system ATP-binding/permease protein